MDEPILFPDVTAAVTGLLGDMTGSPTDYRVSEGYTSGPLIVVRRVGGLSSDRVIDHATVVVEAYEDTYALAHDLAQEARSFLLAVRNDQTSAALLYAVEELGAVGWDPDPIGDRPRFTATYTAHTRGASVAS